MQKGLETFFQDADKGKAKFEGLRKLSNETTFGVDELANSFTQLANVGVNVDTIKDKLLMLGNVAGGDKNKFADLVSIYSKINSVGKAGSMQIQQLAQRGVPIYDMLKKIGVQGTATAEDITKAFQEMTKEGGQFYNAMNNINDTIEGKRGFISDYFKEMTVNFAEVTGLADAYKKVLDILKDAIGTVSDKLLEWNQNPVAKAIIQGIAIASIAGIATTIVTAVIPALTSVISSLKIIVALKTLLTANPIGLALGIGAVALTGIIAGIVSYKKNTEQATQETEKLAKALQDAETHSKNLKSVGVTPEGETRNAELEKEKSWLEALKNGVSEAEEKLNEAKEKRDELLKEGDWDVEWIEQLFGDEWEKANTDIKNYEESIERATKAIKEQEKVVENLQEKVSKVNTLGDLSKTFDEIYEGTIASENKELSELKDQLKQVEDYRQKLQELRAWKDNDGKLIEYNDKTKAEIDKTVEYLQKKINDVELKIKLGNAQDYEKSLQKAFGFDDQTAGKILKQNGGSNGRQWVSEYIRQMNEQNERIMKTNSLMGVNKSVKEKDVVGGNLKNLMKIMDELLKAKGNFGVQDNGKLDNTFKALEYEMSVLEEKFIDVGGSTEELADILNNKAEEINGVDFNKIIEDWKKSSNVGTQIGGYAMGALASASTDGSNFIQGFAQGGLIGGIISTLIGALANVASSCENFDRAMNPITTAFKKLKPIISVLIDMGADFTTGLEQIFEILQPIIKVLGVVLKILRVFGSVVNVLLSLVAKLVDFLFGWLNKGLDAMSDGLDRMFDAVDDFCGVEKDKTDAEKKQLEELRRAREAYASLLDAMEENEAWYIRQRTALNANTRKDSYSVNDMILTPQGQFSTHPDDYIIATKDPQSLGGGAVVNVNIENNVSDVEVSATPVNRNGIQEIMIQISKKIADDVANGANGWDSALARHSSRQAGRQLSF